MVGTVLYIQYIIINKFDASYTGFMCTLFDNWYFFFSRYLRYCKVLTPAEYTCLELKYCSRLIVHLQHCQKMKYDTRRYGTVPLNLEAAWIYFVTFFKYLERYRYRRYWCTYIVKLNCHLGVSWITSFVETNKLHEQWTHYKIDDNIFS